MLTVGIIGLGYWGRNILRVLESFPDVRVKYLCDESEARAYAFPPMAPERYSTTSVNATVGDVDAVLIATPVATHAELALIAIRQGCHVFVEKPLAGSVADAAAVVDAAREAGVTLMVGHTFLYDAAIQGLKSQLGSLPSGSLWMNRLNTVGRRDVSVLWDLGSHDLAILRYCTGVRPRIVKARLTHDWAFVDLFYDDNALAAHLNLSYAASVRERTIELSGTRSLKLDLTRPQDPEPLAVELRDFVNSVRTGRRPRSDGEFGLEIVRQLEWIEREAAQQRPKVVMCAS